ncbi:MAG: phytanoyl-CoA dioxygenase family protein [Caulobacteraceae bacterium]
MITRRHGNLRLFNGSAPEASHRLEREGFAVVEGVLAPPAVAALAAEIEAVFETSGPDRPNDARNEFRHGMLNRSPLSQAALASRAILDVIEPLLGEDCHVIANTAWRNVSGHQGGTWHMDAGPHVPRPEGTPWPNEIPYPIFAIGMHLFLEDCPIEAGPTAVLPGSHRSGRQPPYDRADDLGLTFEGRSAALLTAMAGDVVFFVSDAWHRGTPAREGFRRFFLQAHYARRDIAQRIFTTAEVSHVTAEATARAREPRERTLIGLHAPFFYDA